MRSKSVYICFNALDRYRPATNECTEDIGQRKKFTMAMAMAWKGGGVMDKTLTRRAVGGHEIESRCPASYLDCIRS